MDEVMTVAGLAKYLRLNKVTVYRLIRRQELPAVRVGRHWRLRAEDVTAWMNRHATGRDIAGQPTAGPPDQASAG